MSAQRRSLIIKQPATAAYVYSVPERYQDKY